jgi:diguanylate cyclase (GGDEF)-like protein
LAQNTLTHALNMLQLSLEMSLLRVCECFERERQRTDEELARREEELAFMATHDPLTGLPNRTLILDRVEQMLARATRTQTPVAALFIDLDNFKSINDTLGHSVGDELLKAVAERLKAVVRQADAIGRLGGDEFVVIAEELTLTAAPELVAERLLSALEQPFKLGADGETSLTVTASIGIAAAEEISATDLLRDADTAMYRAKWDGRNRYATFEAGMHDSVQNRMELEMDLRAALEKGEFLLVYQPTFDLADMRPTGVEALVRWQHPKRGLVQPDSFIPLLEETGLISEVGAWILRQACFQGAAWRRAGHAIAMAVNVSARQLDHDHLVTAVEQALAESGLDPEALTLEITETALMRNVEATIERLTAIKRLGVRVAIDDFGTGYSSLGHLQQFPVDALRSTARSSPACARTRRARR